MYLGKKCHDICNFQMVQQKKTQCIYNHVFLNIYAFTCNYMCTYEDKTYMKNTKLDGRICVFLVFY